MEQSMHTNKVFDFFRKIEEIPRGSGNEKAISDYLVSFAKERNLDVQQDAENNVIIKQKATPGYEKSPTIILQGHMDMVCEKALNSNHDFLKDPIELVTEGEWLHAKETTLGADNGIAVAMALAILDSNDIPHGPLEVLITTSEETGMNGAAAVRGEDLEGKYLLNIDTEIEGEFVVSCAGGCRIITEIPLLRENPDSLFSKALELKVDGLNGGHSGIEIHKQRANANQILARILQTLEKDFNFQVASFTGGSKHNAIPRIATSTLVVKPNDLEAIKKAVLIEADKMKIEYTPQDSALKIIATEVNIPKEVLAADTISALVSFLTIAPHGVLGVSQTLDNLVETSENLAIVRETDHTVEILTSIRSSNANALEFARNRLLQLANVLGIQAKEEGRYPAWQYEQNSPLETQAVALYEQLNGQKPKINAIHAGLECGLLKGQLPNTQMLSFGPTIENAHTPQERLHIPSTNRIFEYLKVLLKELK